MSLLSVPRQHGKSTLAGFLLYEQGEVRAHIMREAERSAKERRDMSRKYAYLLDRRPHERTKIVRSGRGNTRNFLVGIRL